MAKGSVSALSIDFRPERSWSSLRCCGGLCHNHHPSHDDDGDGNGDDDADEDDDDGDDDNDDADGDDDMMFASFIAIRTRIAITIIVIVMSFIVSSMLRFGRLLGMIGRRLIVDLELLATCYEY